MNLKLAALTTCAFLSIGSVSNAASKNNTYLKYAGGNVSTFVNGGGTNAPAETIKPIREANARLSLFKTTVSKQPDGYKWETSKVCDRQTKAPVYDVRGKDEINLEMGSSVECKAVLDGKERTVVGFGSVMISERDIFDEGRKVDTKNFNAGIFVTPLSGNSFSPRDNLFGGMWTRDLNLRTVGLDMNQEVLSQCDSSKGGCEIKPQDYLTVTVEIED